MPKKPPAKVAFTKCMSASLFLQCAAGRENRGKKTRQFRRLEQSGSRLVHTHDNLFFSADGKPTAAADTTDDVVEMSRDRRRRRRFISEAVGDPGAMGTTAVVPLLEAAVRSCGCAAASAMSVTCVVRGDPGHVCFAAAAAARAVRPESAADGWGRSHGREIRVEPLRRADEKTTSTPVDLSRRFRRCRREYRWRSKTNDDDDDERPLIISAAPVYAHPTARPVGGGSRKHVWRRVVRRVQGADGVVRVLFRSRGRRRRRT